MADIQGTTITMTQGDSAVIKIQIFNSDGSEYIPSEGDRVRFALKKAYNDPEPLLIKEIPISTMELVLNPEDTKQLQAGVTRGKYKYDIELTRPGNVVDTFIPRADFIVLEEVL